jgi:hypothetical protein
MGQGSGFVFGDLKKFVEQFIVFLVLFLELFLNFDLT